MAEMSSDSPSSGPEFPEGGILWRSYDATIALLEERARPVLAFVEDHDGTRWPFLREILRAMPGNEKLRDLLAGPCAAMLLKSDAIPEYLEALGAGSGYHIAILSPSGFTPLSAFDHATGDPEALVEEIATALAAIIPYWE